MAAAAKDLVKKPVMATVRLIIPAGAAVPGPPVGVMLGQLKLNLLAFCKDFNAKTQKYKPDTPMAVSLIAYKDRTFDFVIKSPTVSWLLKQAAGLESGSGRPGHVFASSAISLKHVYEIAAVKKNYDPGCQHLELDSISLKLQYIGSTSVNMEHCDLLVHLMLCIAAYYLPVNLRSS